MDLYYRLINAEFRVGDFLMPWGMIISVLGFMAAWAVTAYMERRGWTAAVWNLPLFFIALSVVFGCVFGLIFAP